MLETKKLMGCAESYWQAVYPVAGRKSPVLKVCPAFATNHLTGSWEPRCSPSETICAAR